MLKTTKKVIGKLNKCYALAEINMDDSRSLLVGAEKEDPCFRYDLDGNYIETLWEEPGGVMTLEQYGDAVLSTWKFYSPNNSAEAKIVYYIKKEDKWECNVLCDLSFVHRFGILESNGKHYLVACTLKSAHAFKDDWTCPGRVWVGELPKDITIFNQDHQLHLEALISGLTKNHGFCKKDNTALVGSDNGVFRIYPPHENEGWRYEQISTQPASDMLYEDFDNDGINELFVLSPFHGDTISIWKEGKQVYEYPEKLPFLHAIYSGTIHGKTYAFTGCRQGNRELLAIHYDDMKKGYVSEIIDQGAGAANCYFYQKDEKNYLLAANRETDEIAIYELEETC